MPDVGALYPQPPQPGQGGLLSDPLKAIGALQAVQSLQLQGRQFPALAQQPAATLQGTDIENKTRLMQQQESARRVINGAFGTALSGRTDNPSRDEIHAITSYVARMHPEIQTAYPGMISGAADFVLKHPQGPLQGARTLLNMGLSPAEASSLVTAPPDPRTGAARQEPVTSSNLRGARETTVPMGFPERQAGGAAIDVRLADSLAHQVEGSQSRRALLGNLMDLSDRFEPGPGASQSKEAMSFINRNLPLPEGWKFDRKSIADQEEFAKQAAQFAQQQFETIGGTGTDAKFNSAFTVSPNEAMSRMGIKQVSRLLLGNEDAIQAKNKAWLDASATDPNLSYRRFSQEFQSHFDPRVFQFKYVPAKERQEYFDKLDPADAARLLHDMTYARRQGWVNYGGGTAPKPETSGQAKRPPRPPIPGVELGKDKDGNDAWFIRNGGGAGKHLQVKMPSLGQ